MDDVSQSLHQYWFPDGARLHIEAEVMDQASGHKEKAFDWSIAFALQPIRIAVDETRFYFKPGLNHELHVSFLETRTRFFPIEELYKINYYFFAHRYKQSGSTVMRPNVFHFHWPLQQLQDMVYPRRVPCIDYRQTIPADLLTISARGR